MNPDLSKQQGKTLLFYDGVCKFCNKIVQFTLKNDGDDEFRYVALQSKLAEEILSEYKIQSRKLDTVYVITNFKTPDQKLYSHSSAALIIVRKFDTPWKIFGILWIIPKFIRDFFYNIQARLRYRIWGKYDVCRIPTKEEMSKFLAFE